MAKSFRTKLWLYFVMFTAIIFSLLWLLQTVFLQRFYNGMMIRSIRESAEEIIRHSQSSDLTEVIDRLSFEEGLLVYITDEDGEVLYSSDSYKPYFRLSDRPGIRPGGGRNDPHRKAGPPDVPAWNSRGLPDHYDSFLEQIKASPDGKVSYSRDNHYIYGSELTIRESDDDDDDETETEAAVLYVAGMLEPVGAAVSIIRMQLLWVTVLSVVLAFALAWLIARRFAIPISQLSEQAKLLSTDHYEDHFQEGFCRELDELNESLSQSAGKLSEARDYQKELLANVSHDLRTPLTMIRGYAEMVRDISWADEEQRNADTGIIIKEADRLTALVNEILEYSRLQEKDPAAEFSDVDLSALAHSVSDRFEPLFRQDGGRIEREITPDCIVRGDPDLLERAIYNLIENAVHHSAGAEKRIIVTVRRDERIRLEVRDNGEGIAPEELPHIWEKYYTSRQRNHQGVSGLGLAIVKQIAAIHNAEVSAESRRGEGSTFRITF